MKNEKLYLVHIIEASAKIAHYLPPTLAEFEQNEIGKNNLTQ